MAKWRVFRVRSGSHATFARGKKEGTRSSRDGFLSLVNFSCQSLILRPSRRAGRLGIAMIFERSLWKALKKGTIGGSHLVKYHRSVSICVNHGELSRSYRDAL